MSLFHISLIIGAYLIGAIPFGLILSLRSGVDIRSLGSRNIGATNVARTLGKKIGAFTLVADILKGFLPMYGASFLLGLDPDRNLIVALCGAAAVIGHMFPIYLKFKGGKGVATALGIFLFLAPLGVLFALLVFIAIVSLSGFVSLGSMLASASIPLWLWLLDEPVWKLWLAAFVAVMIWFKHHENIGRLMSGTEKSWKKNEETTP